MTDPAIIVASYNAEKSYTHNLDDVIDASDAVGAWGTAKESTTELVDLSGNNNIADIHGPMPTEGFIQGRRFDGVDDYLDCGNDNSLNVGTGDFTLRLILSTTQTAPSVGGIVKEGIDPRYYIQLYNGYVRSLADDGTHVAYADSTVINDGKIHDVCVVFNRNLSNGILIHVDGVDDTSSRVGDLTAIGNLDNNNDLIIGKLANFLDANIIAAFIYTDIVNCITEFNRLARLPFWSVNYTDYPNNVTEYTDNLPYSSSIISSGTFKVDDDKLQCVSAGTMTYSASYEFDGSEYIKIEIGGVEYAGTGTITQGNTTVSVAQGSNKITIEMGTGDTIDGDGIDIQFREEV